MRTIKFRGFNKKNGVWLYGFYLQNRGAHFIAPQEFADGKTWEDYEVEEGSIGQFTGLTDRNGEEIYEGDILAIEGIKYPRHYIVSWNTEKLMFCIGDTPLYALLEAGNTTMREYIVCGNIHDNHKLLKDEKD